MAPLRTDDSKVDFSTDSCAFDPPKPVRGKDRAELLSHDERYLSAAPEREHLLFFGECNKAAVKLLAGGKISS